MHTRHPTLILPTVLHTNGKVERFVKLAKDPKTQKEYESLLRELNASPEDVARKLRAATWKGKTAAEILAELRKK